LSDRALRAPAGDGEVLAAPPLGQAGALIAGNRARLRRPDRSLFGRPWPELQAEARHTAVEAARAYLAACGQPPPPGGAESLLVAGHQPELFHPGVWVKNFALNGLARRHGAAPLNLIVDNDTLKSASLRLPAPPSADRPVAHVASVPFDRWGGQVPWEDRPVLDLALFASFADRAGAELKPWGYEPLLAGFWPEVLRRTVAPGALPGGAFTAARRCLERNWGCDNLEVPLSWVCRTEPFAWFACHLVSELPRFREAYNAAVRAYRLCNRIRSHNHPVPDLAAEDGWLEAPFWGWRAGQSRRARLFARSAPGRVELRAGTEKWPTLPAAPREIVAVWRALEGHGYKVRSRALTTTLYARLFLADLFMHGIGGGKYDELNDEVMANFYGIEPPDYIVLSATRWLPLPAPAATADDHRRLAHELRDLHYNPQRHLSGEMLRDPAVAGLARERQALVEQQFGDAASRRGRFRALRDVTGRLRAPLAGEDARLRRRLRDVDDDLAAVAVLHRRDYSFCLYPEATLRPFCTQFLGGEST
jgi:hypothetical protein